MKRLSTLSTFLLLSSAGYGQALPVPVDTATATRNMQPRLLTPYNNALYFVAEDLANGAELWKYNGTGVPTMVWDLNPGALSGAQMQDGEHMAVVGSTLYFAGDDGTTGVELYKYTGTGAPTLAADIIPGIIGGDVTDVVALGGKVYFSALSVLTGRELYQYDPVTNIATEYDIFAGITGSDPMSLVAMNGKLYFNATFAANGTELAVFDPATNTVTLAADMSAAIAGSDPRNLVVIGNEIYLTAKNDTAGREVYRYNGTTATRITDLFPGSVDGMEYTPAPKTLTIGELNGNVYFTGEDFANAEKLFKYDPVTGVVSDIVTLSISTLYPAHGLITYGGKLYFAADNNVNGNELWSYDGTTAAMVTDLNAGGDNADIYDPLVWNNVLYFTADSGNGSTLYKLAGTVSVKNVSMNGAFFIYPNPVTDVCHVTLELKESASFNLSIFDIAGKLVHSTGLNKYPAGTTSMDVPVANLAPGSYIYSLTNSSNQLMTSGQLTKQ